MNVRKMILNLLTYLMKFAVVVLPMKFLTILKRVIKGSIIKKLSEKGTVPVCLFPTRKACDQLNLEMLNKLDTEICKIPCIDKIDETMGTRRWSKRSAEQLKNLIKIAILLLDLRQNL